MHAWYLGLCGHVPCHKNAHCDKITISCRVAILCKLESARLHIPFWNITILLQLKSEFAIESNCLQFTLCTISYMVVSHLETSVVQHHQLDPEFCMAICFCTSSNTECTPDIWVSVVMFTVTKMLTWKNDHILQYRFLNSLVYMARLKCHDFIIFDNTWKKLHL